MHVLQTTPEQHDLGLEIVRDQLLPWLRDSSGFRGLIRLASPSAGKTLVITLWADEESLQASADAGEEAGRADGGDRRRHAARARGLRSDAVRCLRLLTSSSGTTSPEFLTETTMSLVCVLGEDGRILFFNEACERLTGFTRAEAVGRDARELVIPPEEAEAFGEVLAYIWKTGLASPQVGHWLAKDGTRKLVAWSNKLMPGEDGASSILVTAGIDLSAPPKGASDEAAFEFDLEAKLHEVGRLAQEQRALRRVATLVASEASPERVFTAVSEECARVLEVDASAVFRYEGDDTATIVGRHSRAGDRRRLHPRPAPPCRREHRHRPRAADRRPGAHPRLQRTGPDKPRTTCGSWATARACRRRSSSRASCGAPSESRAPNRCRPTRRHGSAHSASSSPSPSRARRRARI